MVAEKGRYNLIINFACYMNLAICFLPVVDYYCPWYITIIPFILLLLVAVNSEESLFLVIELFVFIILFSLVEYWGVYRNKEFFGYILNFVLAFLPIMFAALLQREIKEKDFYKNYLQVAAIFAAITAVTTIIGLKEYPMASRELASGNAIYDTAKYDAMNIGGYQYIYAMVAFIPVLLFLIKKAKRFLKVFNIILLATIIVCIYESQYTIALIALVFSFIVVWYFSVKRVSKACILIGVILLFSLGTNLISEFFSWLSTVIEKEYVSDRLLQLSQLFAGETINTETLADRIEYYEQQINAFLNSPLWGHNIFKFSKIYVSGHSTILDILGSLGIIGLITVCAIIRALHKKVFNVRTSSKYVKSVWAMMIITAMLNPVIFPTNILVAVMCPMCMLKIDERKE